MYAIKMNDDKTLITTSPASIYRGDRNSDMLVFYLPAAYDEVSIADCTVSLNYILPKAEESKEIDLGIPARLYRGYLVYELAVDEKLTMNSGDIQLWLDFKDGLGVSYFRSSSVMITVLPNEDMEDFVTQAEFEEVSQTIEFLKKSKADNLTYDEDTGELQLTADGEEIGDPVTVECSGTGTGTLDYSLISGGGASVSSATVFSGGDADDF